MMSNPIKLKVTLLCMTLVLFAASGCKGDDGPTPEELRLRELTATWSVASVVNDGTDVTNQFTGFTLVASSDQTYSTTNGGNPWPSQGTFSLVPNNLNAFVRDDNVQVNIASITETTLSLTFQVSSIRSTVNGVNGITGSFTFNLTKTN